MDLPTTPGFPKHALDTLADLASRGRGRPGCVQPPLPGAWIALERLTDAIRAQCSHLFQPCFFTTPSAAVWKGLDASVLQDYRMGQYKLDFLQLAVFMGQATETPEQRGRLLDSLRFWIASGLSPSRFCPVGTATGLSAYTGQIDILGLFAEAGADLFLTCSVQHGGRNETLLHRCVTRGVGSRALEGDAMQAVVLFLDAHYAAMGRPFPVDLQNQTPEEVARSENLPVLAAILEQARLERTFPAATALAPRSLLRL
jgi:hypothetical protein